MQSGTQRIFYSGDSGYFKGFAEIGDRFGGFDLALMENGAYDANWPAVHMTPTVGAPRKNVRWWAGLKQPLR